VTFAQSPSTHTPHLTQARSIRHTLLGWAVCTVVIAGAGCDDLTAGDKLVDAKLNSALTKLATMDGLRGDQLQGLRTDLAAAVGEKSATPAAQAVASAALGAVSHNASIYARAELMRKEVDIRQTLSHLRQMSQQVAFSNYLAAGYMQGKPTEALAKLGAQISAMQGNANVTQWGFGPTQSLPTLASVKQESARLSGEIAKREQQVQDLTTQRNASIAKAESILSTAASLTGTPAVKAYTDAAVARQQADDTAIQIDLVNDQLSRARADLAVQQGQEKAVAAGIAQLQDQSKQVDAGWTDLQQRAANQTAIAAVALNGDADPSMSIKRQAERLALQLAEARLQRTAIVDLLDESEKYYAAAVQQAQTLSTQLNPQITSGKPDAVLYTNLRNALHPQRYKLQAGIVQRDTGALRLSEALLQAEIESTRTMLQTALSSAQLQVPPELDTSGATSLTDLNAASTEKLNSSIETLTNVEQGDSGDKTRGVQNAAKVARLLASVTKLHLLQLKTELGDASAKSESAVLKTDALALRDEIIATGYPMPRLPGDFAVARVAPPAIPATPTEPAPAETAPVTPTP